MSNSLRIQKAIQELRDEPVDRAAQNRLSAKLLRPIRRSMFTPLTAGATSLVIAVAVFAWPSRRAMAWGQVVQATLGTPRLHRTDFTKTAKGGEWTRSGDEWIEGNRTSIQFRLHPSPQVSPVTVDVRFDGTRTYRLDWTGFGVVSTTHSRHDGNESMARYRISTLLEDSRIKLDKSPTEVKIDGVNRLRYLARAGDPAENPKELISFAIYVEKDGGRVVRLEWFNRNGEVSEYSTIDYPTSLPPGVFLPPTSGPKVFDLDRDADLVRRSMAKGITVGEGNVLRAVIQSPSGELVVLWTGTPPNGDGSQRPKVVGNPCKGAYAPDSLTASRWKVNPKGIYRFDGQPLCGLALNLTKPVSGKISLQMPVLVPNRADPLRNSKGEVVGYRSKQVGTTTIKDFPIIQTMPFGVLGYMNGSRR